MFSYMGLALLLLIAFCLSFINWLPNVLYHCQNHDEFLVSSEVPDGVVDGVCGVVEIGGGVDVDDGNIDC